MVSPIWKLSLLMAFSAVTAACATSGDSSPNPTPTTSSSDLSTGGGAGGPVGLSLWFQNGAVRLENGDVKTVDIYDDVARYVQELDITSEVDTTTDQGITPVTHSGDMAKLDWSGVHVVDEAWREELGSTPTTYTRQIFYRGAKWMERTSVLSVIPTDANGIPVGEPIVELAGSDNQWLPSDDGFVRRFDARQITTGCRAIGDCSNATTFKAQGLMQIRDAMHADLRARPIPWNAKKLQIFWSEDPIHFRSVDINRKTFAGTPYRYGFQLKLDILTPPANGQYYVPGEEFDFRVNYLDGQGNRLAPLGALPSYQDFATDNVPSGIRYYDGFKQLLTLYYALKHREGNTIWEFSGPSSNLHLSTHVVSDVDFLTLSGTPGHIPSATIPENGYNGIFDILPTVGGTLDPVLSTLPNSDVLHVTVPADAQPGTYNIAFKGRRDWGGEALNETGITTVQVGQPQPTTFVPTTGNCQNCHNNASGFDKILHRNADRSTCFGCHMTLQQEPDQVLDYRIHYIHTRSNRVPADPNNCSMCHLTPPNGAPRGFPGVGL